MNNNKRIAYFDALNALSCFGVVCLHSNGYVHSFDKNDLWWLRVLIEVLFYFAVPVFFMLSGATLISYRKRYSTTQFIRKRVLRTVFPYFFWGVFFYGVSLYSGGFSGIEITDIVSRFSTGKIPYTNYWFFIPLFLIYIFIPFLSLMVIQLTKRQMICLIIIMIVLQSLLPTLYAIIGEEFKVSLPLGGYFIYAIIGYFIASFDIEKNSTLCYSIYSLAICSLMARFIILYLSDIRQPMLFTYFGLYAIFPSIAIFIFFKRLRFSNVWVSNVLAFLAKRSFGIFLIHTFLIFILSKFVSDKNPWFIPLSALSVYFVSLLVVTGLKKFRLTKVLVP